MKFCMFCVKDVCEMYEMKMNNLLFDVEIFSLCRKETLFQAEFEQHKWKSLFLFLADKL